MEKLNRIIENYPPELKFLLVCCGSERWKAEDLLPGINWELFLQWVKRHRVNPAVYRYIKKKPAVLPEEIKNTIEQRYFQITKRNLLLANETIQICTSLEKHGIKAIPLKGVFLSKQINNDYNHRETRDIDILVDLIDIPASIPILTNLGYINKNKITDDYTKRSFQFTNNHIVINNPEKNTSLELHWRLFPFSGLGENTQNQINNNSKIDYETNLRLAKVEDHMNFVIMHGHSHWWHALQWLMDVKEYLKIKNPAYEPDVFDEVFDILQQTEVLIKLLFNNKNNNLNNTIFTRWLQQNNIKNSLLVIAIQDSEKLVNPILRIKRMGLFLDLNRDRKWFWLEYLKYLLLKIY